MNVKSEQLVGMEQKGTTESFKGSILDWEVDKLPLYYSPSGDELIKSSSCATVRMDTGEQLGTVGEGYGIIQNSHLYEALCNSLATCDYTIANMGMTDNGSRVFIQADVGGYSDFSINGDAYKGYITLWSSHDASCGTTCGDTTTRLTCMNQFVHTRKKGNSNFRMHVRKTKNASFHFDEMMKTLESMVLGRQDLIKKLEILMNTPMSDNDARLFSLGYHNSSKQRGVNLSNHIFGLYRYGMGNNGKTRYDMFNGFTEFHTHGFSNSRRKNDSQLKSSLFGGGHRTKNKVLNELLCDTTVNNTISRGRLIQKELATA